MKKQFKFIGRHLVLLLLAVIWLIPIVWLVVTSFSGYKGINTAHFFPQTWSLDNYVALFLKPDSVVQYKKWFADRNLYRTDLYHFRADGCLYHELYEI